MDFRMGDINNVVGLALAMYVVAVLYLHNNNKELLMQYNSALPILALLSYYVASPVLLVAK